MTPFRVRWLLLLCLGGPAPAQSTDRTATLEEAAKLRSDGELERAALVYESIIRSQPENGEAWYLLGFTLHELREYDRAIYVHSRAAEFPRYRATALYNLGCAYALQGKKDEAFDALRRALDAGYVNRVQYETDTDLTDLKADPRWQRLFGIDEEGRNHELDFLLGRWSLIGPDGRGIGQSVVERRQNGFLIHEEVTLDSGVSADRFHYYDPREHVWRMSSVDGRGGAARTRGRFSEGAMTFEGARVNPDATEMRCRITIAPAQNNTVLYSQEIAFGDNDWRPVLQARYVRRRGPDARPGPATASAPADVQPATPGSADPPAGEPTSESVAPASAPVQTTPGDDAPAQSGAASPP